MKIFPSLFEKFQKQEIIYKTRVPHAVGYHEWDIYADYIQKDHIVYDVGAHTGWMSEYFCQVAKHVHAFEPVPEFFEQLKDYTKEFSNIDYHQIAFSDVDDNEKIVDPHGRGRGARSLNSYMEEKSLDFPDFVKVDIEGFESLFFKEADSILKKGKTFFYVEMHMWLENFRFAEDGGFDWNKFKKYPYTAKKFNWKRPDNIWDEPITLTDDQEFNPRENETFNYFFIPHNI